MEKLSLCLFGKHSKRTPFAYAPYRHLVEQKFYYSNDPYSADFLVTGFIKDFLDDAELIDRIKTKNVDCKLVVVSEEPLWDTLWTTDFTSQQTKMKFKEKEYDIFQFNHYTTNIFDFDSFPYYITTSDQFYVRYTCMLKNALAYTTDELEEVWRNAAYAAAFIAEKRTSQTYCKAYDAIKTFGLSKYRTDVALCCAKGSTLIEGKDWQNGNGPRQHLPDWHLDKLVQLNRSSVFISALENTYFKTYVSEKIFDAYCCLGIPVYMADAAHSIRKILKNDSWLNVYGLSPEEAAQQLFAFTRTPAFRTAYAAELRNLAGHFSNHDAYVLERRRFAEAFMDLLFRLAATA